MFACQISKLICHYFYHGKTSRSERSPHTADEICIRIGNFGIDHERENEKIYYFSLSLDNLRYLQSNDIQFKNSSPHNKRCISTGSPYVISSNGNRYFVQQYQEGPYCISY